MNNISGRVSVIIPTYDRSQLLKRAIKSVLNQTYEKFEIIIIDDNSQDDTKRVVDNFRDKRIRYFRNKKNVGGSAARNIGIKKAQYNYIAFLDDDDEWLPKKLEKQVNLIQKLGDEYCGVFTGIAYYKNGKEIKKRIPKKDGELFNKLLHKNYIGSTSVIFLKKKALENVGYFNEKLPAKQDLELYLRLSQNYKFKAIREPLVNYHIHSDQQIGDDYGAYLYSTNYIYNKYRSYIVKDNILHSNYMYKIAYLNLRDNNKYRARKYLKKGLKLNFKLKYFIVYLLIYVYPAMYIYLSDYFYKQ